ncbi:FYVE finger-containing protein [Ceraceosorus bombacis]|uniref:FYVE finger-containing protein n=1 Tax=Ceraceosorus bombacis TaxID=401625 RepID=A0A0P1BG06_9BASI|nr:FYVE finger-containing protein [Ceraceosorus bombacis]
MASSPTPSSSSTSGATVTYRPYVSHRRNASSLASSASITPAATPPPPSLTPPIESASAQDAGPSQSTPRAQHVLPPSNGISPSVSSPPPARKAVLPSSSTTTSAAPPPLRRISALRAQESAPIPNGKGKGKSRSAAQTEAAVELDAQVDGLAADESFSVSLPNGDGESGATTGRALGAAAVISSSNGKSRPTATNWNGPSRTPGSVAPPSPRGNDAHSSAQSKGQASRNRAQALTTHKPSRSLAGQSELALPHHISTAARLREHNRSPSTISQNSIQRGVHSDAADMDHVFATIAAMPGMDLNADAGFQPKGTERNRSEEFLALRRDHKSKEASKEMDLEGERMERRLEKLTALHFSGGGQEGSVGSFRGSASAGSWANSLRGWASAEKAAEAQLRQQEMQIVRWEDDGARKTCPICSTPFSLAVRKHHCRLCGSVVCASPHLSLPPGLAQSFSQTEHAAQQAKCSGLVLADPQTSIIRDANATSDGRVGFRICTRCRATITRRQYMLDDEKVPVYLQLYEALIQLQREIEQTLPEFQEMVLGLQKQDASAALGTGPHGDLQRTPTKAKSALTLQRNAAQARKALLANFANYDALARRIQTLPAGTNQAQKRVQESIWTRANLFLQQNMFPLQSLPGAITKGSNEKSRSKKSDASASLSGTNSAAAQEAVQELQVLEEQYRSVSAWADAAQSNRQLEDARTLRASADEVAKEVQRRRRELTELGILRDH